MPIHNTFITKSYLYNLIMAVFSLIKVISEDPNPSEDGSLITKIYHRSLFYPMFDGILKLNYYYFAGQICRIDDWKNLSILYCINTCVRRLKGAY